jgi:DNA replication protein DnaC
MPALKLRQEFLATHMRATAIELCNKQNTGWAQRKNPKELLEFTFPTADIQRALDGISTTSGGKPVVFIGQRGRGKSHIMAVLHHALASPELAAQNYADVSV